MPDVISKSEVDGLTAKLLNILQRTESLHSALNYTAICATHTCNYQCY